MDRELKREVEEIARDFQFDPIGSLKRMQRGKPRQRERKMGKTIDPIDPIDLIARKLDFQKRCFDGKLDQNLVQMQWMISTLNQEQVV